MVHSKMIINVSVTEEQIKMINITSHTYEIYKYVLSTARNSGIDHFKMFANLAM